MEWPRIKNILIIALLFTNILFIVLLLNVYFGSEATENDASESDTLQILEKNNITVSADIPDEHEKMPVLVLRYDQNKGEFPYLPTENYPVEDFDEDAALLLADKFWSAYNDEYVSNLDDIRVSDVKLSENAEHTYEITYMNYYDNCRIEDVYAVCYMSPNGIVKMDRYWASIDGVSKNSKNIISPYIALPRFMADYKTKNPNTPAEIIKIDLVYRVESSYSAQVTTDTAFPAWKITLSDYSVYFVSAHE